MLYIDVKLSREKMKIAIDCRFLGKSGIGTYLENILIELLKNHPENRYLLICNRIHQELACYTDVKLLLTDVEPFSLKELFFFPVKEINSTDVFFSPYINIPGRITVPIYSTVHDVIFLDLPYMVSSLGLLARKWFISRAIRKSETVFTVSEFSKKRIEYHFGCRRRIEIVSNVVAEHIRSFDITAIHKEDVLIYVGNIKPHKGLSTLLEAYALAKKEGMKSRLLLVGETEKFRTSDNRTGECLNDMEGIEFTGRVDDNKLCQLIAQSRALILPSTYEGFGIPPMEAMYLGTNVILSDIEVLKEVYEDLPVTFFCQENAVDLKNKLVAKQEVLDVVEARKRIDNSYEIGRETKKMMSIIKHE